MTHPARRSDARPGFWDQLVRDERRRQFYSRALGVVMVGLLAAIGLLGVVAAHAPAPAHPDCRAVSGLPPPAFEPMALELAGDPAAVRRLLRGPESAVYPADPAHAEAMCIEDRIARHRRLLDLDGLLFIPLYLLLGMAALAWHGVLALRARGAAWMRRGQLPLSLVAGLLLSALVLGLTGGLDLAENRAAHAVLDLALGGLTPADLDTAGWRTAVSGMHDASVRKWAALAAWAGTLASLAALRRHSLSRPRGSDRRRRWSAGAAWLLLLSAAVAAGLLGGGALWATLAISDDNNATARTWIGAGFAAVFVHALVLLLLHCLNLPRPLPTVPQR